MNWSIRNLLFTSTVVGLSISPVLAVNITGFIGDYGSTNWSTTTSSNGIGTVSQDTTVLDVALNCDLDPNGNCPSGINLDPLSYIEQSISITSQMSGIIEFEWIFDYSDGTVNAGYVLNGTFVSMVTGNNDTTSQSNAAPQTVIVNDGDTFGLFVQAVTNPGTVGTFNVKNFKVKDIPFEFNPLQGVALGLPLFIGLKILKKRAKHNSQ